MTRQTTVAQTFGHMSVDVSERFPYLVETYRSDSLQKVCFNYWDYRGKSRLYETFLQQFPQPSQNTYPTLFGLEVETENVLLQRSDEKSPAGWDVKSDGSLRNGVEFVSCVADALEVQHLITSLYLFFGEQLKHKPDFSWRTSIHVHVNCRKLNTDTLANLVLLYSVFEMLLFKFINDQRKTSNFCVPITESWSASRIREFINAADTIGKPIRILTTDWEKYSALNFSRMHDLGTAEFRHMSGTWDIEKLWQWIEVIGALYDASIRLEHSWIVQQIMQLNSLSNYAQFQNQVFGGALSKVLGEAESFKQLLSNGVSFAKQCLVKPEKAYQNIHKDSFANAWINATANKIGKMPKPKLNLNRIHKKLSQEALTHLTGMLGNSPAYWITSNTVPPGDGVGLFAPVGESPSSHS